MGGGDRRAHPGPVCRRRHDPREIIGAGLSVLGLWCLMLLVRDQLPISIDLFGSSVELQFIDWGGIALILAIGGLLGASGSLFSLRRFMKTWRG